MNVSLDVPLSHRRATRRLGAALARQLRAGDVVFLEGALGAGKTFLVRAIARGLGVPESVPIQSPTFALVHEHAASELDASGARSRVRLLHADLYRIEQGGSLEAIGLEDTDDAIVLIEWGERFRSALEPRAGSLLVTLGGAPRQARLTGRGRVAQR